MLSVNIICVGKLKETYLKDATLEYTKRLFKYCNIHITEIQDEPLPNKLNPSIIEDIKQKEACKILEHIKKDSYVIALDLTRKYVF